MGTLFLDSGGAATNSGTSDNNAADLSGAANATLGPASVTFVDGNVTVATDVINIAGHGITSGTGGELTSSGTLPAGLTLLTLYYVFAVDANNITLHTNVADALAGTNPVDITAAAGGGTHTFTNMTVKLGGAPDLSGVIASHCRLTTTGLSHVFTMGGGIHGITDGDQVVFEISTSGTMPTGLTEGIVYHAKALSSTTFRVYSSRLLAIAGGASDINVSAVQVRTLTIRIANQSAIALASATNANRKIFWVRAVDNTNKQLILAAAVTGLGAGSNWAIGGRIPVAGLTDLFNAIRIGDIVYQNTDISITSGGAYTYRNHEGKTFGWTRWIGKPGARRVLTSSVNGVTLFNSFGSVLFKNLAISLTGSGAANTGFGGSSFSFDDVTITDCNICFGGNAGFFWLTDCEVTGVSDFWSATNTGLVAFRNHFHDNGTTGFTVGYGSAGITYMFFVGNLIDRSAVDGLSLSNLSTNGLTMRGLIAWNTFYRSSRHGIRLTGGWTSSAWLQILDNVLKDNGDAATEANFSFEAQPLILIERRNLLSIAGARGGIDVQGITLDSSDVQADPLFIDPDASAGSRSFGLKDNSPAKGTKFPFSYPGSLTVSYRDLGAVQAFPRSPRAQSMIGM